jgi:hypothetical protein
MIGFKRIKTPKQGKKAWIKNYNLKDEAPTKGNEGKLMQIFNWKRGIRIME